MLLSLAASGRGGKWVWLPHPLQCYNHLTEWAELSRAAMVNVDDASLPSLDKLWDDTYCQVMLM